MFSYGIISQLPCGDAVGPFLLCSKFRYCSSSLGAKQPEVIIFLQLYTSSHDLFQVTYELWVQENDPNSHKLLIPKLSNSGSHAAFADLSVSTTKPREGQNGLSVNNVYLNNITAGLNT